MAKGISFKIAFNKLPEVAKKLPTIEEARVRQATLIWHGSVVRTLAGTRSGRVYRVPETKKTYRASAPGEPPAVRTGALRSRYGFKFTRERGNFVGQVGNPLEYSLYLEKGTSRMAPRPHLVASFEKERQTIIRLLTRPWF
ncbi:MAG: HK97 gp10 family phage protein [Candidatus Heimdallarchaeaceae archaeon]